MNRSGLGRGLAALLPDAEGRAAGAGVLQLELDAIRPNPYQPRRDFDQESLNELADSIREHGLVQPVTVRQSPDGEGYQIIAGERRWRAARLVGMPTLPALVRPCSEREMLEMALVENLQREDINPLEAAEAYRRCLEEFGLTQDELAQRVGKSRAAVANTLRLLKLAPAVRSAVADGRLSEGHGRALLALIEEEDQLALARRVMNEGLTVRQTERLARDEKAVRRARRPVEATAGGAGNSPDPHLAAYAERLQRALGTRVEVHPAGGGGGSIVIRYYANEDLDRIAEAVGA